MAPAGMARWLGGSPADRATGNRDGWHRKGWLWGAFIRSYSETGELATRIGGVASLVDRRLGEAE